MKLPTYSLRELVVALSLGLASPALYAAPGDPVGQTLRVNSHTVGNQIEPSVAVAADGGFVVAWTSPNPDGCELGVYARRYAADGTAQGAEFRVNLFSVGDQSAPSIAMDAEGNFVIAWQSDSQGVSGHDIYAQRYAADGTPAGNEFRVNSYTAHDQSAPSVAVDADGDFVVVWHSKDQDGGGYGVYAQHYAADGTPAGSEFLVNSFKVGHQRSPSVAIDDGGNFVVAWESYDQDGSGSGVYARRYAADGMPAGSEFRVNSFTSNQQSSPSVAVDADGDFVVGWLSSGQHGNSSYVYAQRYAADGTPAGREFRANSFNNGSQLDPSVAVDADGDFVVAWFGPDPESQDPRIFARRFTANGVPSGGEIFMPMQINSPSFWSFWSSVEKAVSVMKTRARPRVTLGVGRGGNFVVVWPSIQDGRSGQDIYAQRYQGKVAASTVATRRVVADPLSEPSGAAP